MISERIQDMTFFELVLQLKHLELLLRWPKSIGPPIRKLLVILEDSRSSQFFPIRQRCIFSKLGHHLSFCSALFNSTCILSFAVVGYQEQRLRSTEKKNVKYIYIYDIKLESTTHPQAMTFSMVVEPGCIGPPGWWCI